jgi:hypothetical protein
MDERTLIVLAAQRLQAINRPDLDLSFLRCYSDAFFQSVLQLLEHPADLPPCANIEDCPFYDVAFAPDGWNPTVLSAHGLFPGPQDNSLLAFRSRVHRQWLILLLPELITYHSKLDLRPCMVVPVRKLPAFQAAMTLLRDTYDPTLGDLVWACVVVSDRYLMLGARGATFRLDTLWPSCDGDVGFLQLHSSLLSDDSLMAAVLAHELVHLMRLGMPRTANNEVLAYACDPSRTRRWLGPLTASLGRHAAFALASVSADHLASSRWLKRASKLPFVLSLIVDESITVWHKRRLANVAAHLDRLGIMHSGALLLRLSYDETLSLQTCETRASCIHELTAILNAWRFTYVAAYLTMAKM